MEQPITNTTPVEAPAGQTQQALQVRGADLLGDRPVRPGQPHRRGYDRRREAPDAYRRLLPAPGDDRGVCPVHRRQSLRPARRVLQGASPEGRHQGQKPGDQFFLRRGLSPEDGKDLRRLCVRLSMTLHSGFTDLMRMTIGDLVETTKEVIKISKEAAKRGKRK